MRRDYTTAEYAQIVATVRAAVPDIGITADVIVGFPGETEDEFAATCAFVAAQEFAGVHVFPTSARPGTPALAMPDQINPPTRQARVQTLIEPGHRAHEVVRGGHARPRAAGTPGDGGPTGGSGLTDDYLRVQTRRPVAPNTITPPGCWPSTALACGRSR